MAKLFSRVRVETSTTGTGDVTIGAPVAGFTSFANAGVVDGDTVSYVIEDGAGYEIGTGVYTASGTTLTRNVIQSSNSNSALSLTGNAELFLSLNSNDVYTQDQAIGITIALG